MSLHLGPRSACGVQSCSHECDIFVSEHADGSPKYSDFESADVLCFICSHTWMAHKGGTIDARNRPFIRGGTADEKCAAFHSVVFQWNMRLVCLCSLLWSRHQVMSTIAPTSDTAAVSNSTPPPPTAFSSTALVPQRPVMAFAGLPRPSVLSVQSQRRASMQRNFHPNQPASGSTSTSPARKAQRLSGPPRPYSETVATSSRSVLDDFAVTATEAFETITVFILPKVLDTSSNNDPLDISPMYTWKSGREMEEAQLRLQTANLVFTVKVSTTGPIFESINVEFEKHCRFYKIQFFPVPPGPVPSPNGMPWVLLSPMGRSPRRYVESSKSLTRFTFTLQALRAVPYSHTANNLGEGAGIFIAPTASNLVAPIDCLFDPIARIPDHVRTHTCFGRRVLHPMLSAFAGDPAPECGPSCNLDDSAGVSVQHPLPEVLSDSDDDEFPDPATMMNEMTSYDALSPSSPIVTRSVTRQQDLDTAAATAIPISTGPAVTAVSVSSAAAATAVSISTAPVSVHASTTDPFVPAALLARAMELSGCSLKPRSFLGVDAALDLTLQHMPGAGSNTFAAWQDHLLLPREREMDEQVIISASSIDEAARALIALCLWLFAGRPRGLKFKEIIREQFPSPEPTIDGATTNALGLFGLHVTIGASLALGRGPRNEVVARAVQIMLADAHFWAKQGEYLILRLHPSCSPIPARSCLLKATGLLFLLHFLFIGTPVPVSPFIFATLFDGRKTASKFDLDFISHFISEDSLSFIKKLQNVPLDHPLYASQSATCVEYQYLLNIPGFDPTLISPTRSQAEHDGVICSVVSYVTLGTVDLEHHSDFMSVGDGFNVCVDQFDDQDRSHHVLEWFATPCRQLIIAAYNRRIRTAADVISHLQFAETNPESDPWNENSEVVALLTRSVAHYLREPGHPSDPDGVFSAVIDNAGNPIDNGGDPADPLLRPRLFLSVVTGSVLLPTKPNWTARCIIINDWNDNFPTITDGHEDCGRDVSIAFRSCFKTLTITNNASLRRLLAEELKTGVDTEFGRWLHSQLLASRSSYNSS